MPLPGPAFIRLLARLTDVDVPPSRHALSDRLSHWVDWNRAIVLSRALDGSPAAGADAPAFGSAEEAECARLRTSLTQAVLEAPELNPKIQRAHEEADADDATASPPLDFATFRKRYVARQQAMQTATGDLRGRLRDMLAAQSSERARLAEVDAVMELTLSPREQALLAAVPTLLGEHFERLRQAERPPTQDAPPPPDGPPAASGAWLGMFSRDMQQLLLAELELRFQPIDGLLAALRTR